MVSLLPRSTATAQPLGAEHSEEDEDADVSTVLDPACFHATLLMAVADRFGGHVRLAGQEIHESDADIAALNVRSNAHTAI